MESKVVHVYDFGHSPILPLYLFLNNLLDLMVKNEVNVFDKAQLISGHLPPALVIAIESNVWFTASGQGDCIHIRAVRI